MAQDGTEKMQVGLAGVGAMGSRFGSRILAAGHELWLLPHRNLENIEALCGAGARTAATARELARQCDVVITALPDVPDVREVHLGEDGLASGARRGQLFIDMSTISPTAAREHHALLAEKGVPALDAPVSGGPVRAADGTLTIMVGGDEAAFEQALPFLSLFGSHIVYAGPPGAGQAVKLVNQLI